MTTLLDFDETATVRQLIFQVERARAALRVVEALHIHPKAPTDELTEGDQADIRALLDPVARVSNIWTARDCS